VAKKLLDVPQNSGPQFDVVITFTLAGVSEDETVNTLTDLFAKEFPGFIDDYNMVITAGSVEVNGK
jgi:hypothetical protein